MSNKKNKVTTFVLVIVFLVGLSVMLYSAVSDWWNKKVQSCVVAGYQKAANELDDKTEAELLKRAYEYNKELAKLPMPLLDYEQVPDYDKILDITGTGVMGIINITQIGVELPIYHGTREGVLNIAVGHLQGSSLPVGGAGTHSVISAHRGLPSARLFTDLDQLVEGDEFTVTVLKEIYTYEVEEINIVLPNEIKKLAIDPDRDLITLMTCTPYGVNTHRLLVRARRVGTSYVQEEGAPVKVSPDAVQLDTMAVVPFIAMVPVVGLLAWWLFDGNKKSFPYDDPLSVFEKDGKKDKNSPE